VTNFLSITITHVQACSTESKDGLGLSIVVLVFPTPVSPSVGKGMRIVKGGLFQFLPNDFSIFAVSLYLTLSATFSLSLISEFLWWFNLAKSSSGLKIHICATFNFFNLFWIKIQVSLP
jgi:hypothetical protein